MKNAKIFDLTDPQLAKKFGYSSNLGRKATQKIAKQAKRKGFNFIKFAATKGDRANYVVMKDWDKVLRESLPLKK